MCVCFYTSFDHFYSYDCCQLSAACAARLFSALLEFQIYFFPSDSESQILDEIESVGKHRGRNDIKAAFLQIQLRVNFPLYTNTCQFLFSLSTFLGEGLGFMAPCSSCHVVSASQPVSPPPKKKKKRRLDLPKLLVNTFRANLDLIKLKNQPFKNVLVL